MSDALARVEDTELAITLSSETSISKFKDVLGSRAPHFIMGIKTCMTLNQKLLECTPESVVNAALQGAVMDLSFDPSIGEAYLVPFNKKTKIDGRDVWRQECTFIPGYKGLIQIALRTNQFLNLHACGVTKKALEAVKSICSRSSDPTRETIRFFDMIDFETDMTTGAYIGYIAYFVLTNGFKKFIYWDKQKAVEHGKKYSKTFKYGPWQTNEDDMCIKTLIRQLIIKYAPKSKEMRNAIESQTYSENIIIEESGRYAAIRSGQEDEDLFGAEPGNNGELNKAYTVILDLTADDHPSALKNSIKKHLGVERLEECRDLDKLRAYYAYKRDQKRDQKKAKAFDEEFPQEAIDEMGAIVNTFTPEVSSEFYWAFDNKDKGTLIQLYSEALAKKEVV